MSVKLDFKAKYPLEDTLDTVLAIGDSNVNAITQVLVQSLIDHDRDVRTDELQRALYNEHPLVGVYYANGGKRTHKSLDAKLRDHITLAPDEPHGIYQEILDHPAVKASTVLHRLMLRIAVQGVFLPIYISAEGVIFVKDTYGHRGFNHSLTTGVCETSVPWTTHPIHFGLTTEFLDELYSTIINALEDNDDE